MITRIEVLDGDTGKTTLALNLSSPFSLVAISGTLLADTTTVTLERVMRYADRVWSTLQWIETDAGYRTTVIYGRYRVWFYSDQTISTQE